MEPAAETNRGGSPPGPASAGAGLNLLGLNTAVWYTGLATGFVEDSACSAQRNGYLRLFLGYLRLEFGLSASFFWLSASFFGLIWHLQHFSRIAGLSASFF